MVTIAVPKVFVTDGRSIATLAIIKSLADKGIEVTCGEEYRACPAFFSRYVKHRFVYPSPEEKPEAFIATLKDHLKNNKYDALIPVRDDTTLLFSKHKEEFAKYTNLPIADYETILKGRSKILTLKEAIKHGIPCPQTYFLDEHDLEYIANNIYYPALIRPCKSSGGRGITLVNKPAELLQKHDAVLQAYGECFFQEYIPHNDHRLLIHALFNKGNILASCVIESIRLFPEKIGPTVYAHTIINEPILETATKLLQALGWHGVAEAEFILDQRGNTPKLMEINPRFGNPVGLVIEAGLDLPHMLYNMAKGESLTPCLTYKENIKWRWLFPGDMLWFLKSTKKRQALKHFIRFKEKDLHYAVLSFKDPGPTLGTLAQSIKFTMNKRKRDFILNRGI